MSFYTAVLSNSNSIVEGVRPDLSISTVGGPQQTASDDIDIMIEEDDVQTSEAIAPRPVTSAIQPTQHEREQHNLTHVPFRDWCEDCIKGKANERSFSSVEHEPNCLPCFHADYMFMGEGEIYDKMPILALKDDERKSVFANVVPAKA